MLKKNDVILIGGIVSIAVLALLLMWFLRTGGDNVVISVGGEVYGKYNLNKDDVIFLETGEGTNTVRIQDGSVTMIEASCPDQICVHTMAISKENPGMIVCLPHEVVVEIKE